MVAGSSETMASNKFTKFPSFLPGWQAAAITCYATVRAVRSACYPHNKFWLPYHERLISQSQNAASTNSVRRQHLSFSSHKSHSNSCTSNFASSAALVQKPCELLPRLGDRLPGLCEDVRAEEMPRHGERRLQIRMTWLIRSLRAAQKSWQCE